MYLFEKVPVSRSSLMCWLLQQREKIKQTLVNDTFLLFVPKMALVLDLIATLHIHLCIQVDFCTHLGVYICIIEHL